jgi:hypothetical protein
MKLSSIIFASMVAFTQADDSQRRLANLAEKWNITDPYITDPSFSYDSIAFDLTFGVSSFVSGATMADHKLYDIGCKEGGNEVTIGAAQDGVTSSVQDNAGIGAVAGDGAEMDRSVSLSITLDPAVISDNSLLYSEDTTGSRVTAEIRFCVRFGLFTTGPTALEVNFLETLVTLTVDLTDGFKMGSIAVELKDKLTQPFLFANVHQSSSGSVTGSGVGSRLFGTDTKSRLRSGGDRNLQADEVAGASEFELDFTIAKADNVQGSLLPAPAVWARWPWLSSLLLAFLLACSNKECLFISRLEYLSIRVPCPTVGGSCACIACILYFY